MDREELFIVSYRAWERRSRRLWPRRCRRCWRRTWQGWRDGAKSMLGSDGVRAGGGTGGGDAAISFGAGDEGGHDVNELLQRSYVVHGKDYSARRALFTMVADWVGDPRALGRQVGWVTQATIAYVRPLCRITVCMCKTNGQRGVSPLLSPLKMGPCVCVATRSFHVRWSRQGVEGPRLKIATTNAADSTIFMPAGRGVLRGHWCEKSLSEPPARPHFSCAGAAAAAAMGNSSENPVTPLGLSV